MNIRAYQIIGFIFTAAFGTLLHFVYEWLGSPVYAAIFSAVNESVWEHVRLLMIPYLLFTLIEFVMYGRYINNFAPVKCLGLILGMLVIIAGYYTINGVFGESGTAVDICLFYLAVLASYVYCWARLNTLAFCSTAGRALGALGLILFSAAAVVLTFYPPEIPLFRDPIDGAYGIK